MEASTGPGAGGGLAGRYPSKKKSANPTEATGGKVKPPYGKALGVEDTYTYGHEVNGGGEEPDADDIVEHNPFFMAPGMAAGYRPRDLWGKGLKKVPDFDYEAPAERQWGDPKDDGWYR